MRTSRGNFVPNTRSLSPVTPPPSPRRNHLLAALSSADYERLLPDLEPVALTLGQAVYESGGVQGYV